MASPDFDSTTDLAAALASVLPKQNVVTSREERAFYSSDVYSAGHLAELVAVPDSVEQLRDVVAEATRRGRAVIARGGGLSYTGGYLPVHAQSVIIDTSRLNRIVEINREDMYVTVEVGCTWVQLYERLKAEGLRTPYFGPMSGFSSTVGGALSQGSVFLGSTQYGSTAESVLSLDVILADGSTLATGSAAGLVRPSPFFRAFGPDLTGLFLNDAGALGIKARATLQVIPFPEFTRVLSFSYESTRALFESLADVARSGLAAECFGTDPYVQSRRIHEQNLGKDLGYLKAVATGGETLLAGLGNAARMAWKGRRSLGGESHVMHVTADASTREAADAAERRLRGIGAKRGREIEATVPRAIRSMPFVYPNDLLGDRGERWVPTHCLAPHSRAVEVVEKMERFFADQDPTLRTHRIEWGYVIFAVSMRTTLIEPLFYWPEARTAYHERMIEPAYLAKLPVHPPNPEATAAVRELRLGLTTLFADLGCAHLQIGKTYPYLSTRQPVAARVLRELKSVLDPRGLVNPGALQLE
jgi:FAD/FMN-containing dehydrogenase